MRRVLIVVGMLGLGLIPGTPAHASADSGGNDRGGIVWRLSADGDWLVGLRDDPQPETPIPFRPVERRPSVADVVPSAGLRAGPSLVLRLDPVAMAPPGSHDGSCSLPMWLSLAGTGACAGSPSAGSGGLSATLSWIADQASLGLRAETWTLPIPATGSLTAAPALAATAPNAWPLVIGESATGRLAIERFGIDGRVRLGEDLGLRWAAAVAAVEPIGPIAGTVPGFDQQSLSLGLARGAWSGGLTGRLTRPRPAGERLAEIGALDLEVSWITPWEGELSFGAENLIVRDGEFKPAVPAPRSAPPALRAPFVRYRQDF